MAGVSSDRLIPCVTDVATQDTGWRGRIRTFDLLIQSHVLESGLADAVLNVIRRSAAFGFRVNQVPIRKRIRCPFEKPNESGAHSGTVWILVLSGIRLNAAPLFHLVDIATEEHETDDGFGYRRPKSSCVGTR